MSLNSEGVYTLNTKTCMTEIMTNHRNSMRYYDLLFSMDLTNLKKISIPFSQFIVSQLCSFTYVFIYRQPTEREFQLIQTAPHG